MEEVMELMFGGLLAGFSIAVIVVKAFIAVLGIVIWLVSRWVLRKALRNAGVATSSLIYVPIFGDFDVVLSLSKGGWLPFFSFKIAPVVPMVYTVLSAVSILFFPFLLKLIVGALGWFCNGAVYTRIWDVSQGREDGHSSWWGLISAVFKVILVVKCLLMAFSVNGIKQSVGGGDLYDGK